MKALEASYIASRRSRDVLLERAQLLLRLALEADQDPHDDAVAERGGIEVGMVAADHPRLLQRLDPPEAGRRGETDALGQFDVGHPAIVLKQREDLPVDPVQSH